MQKGRMIAITLNRSVMKEFCKPFAMIAIIAIAIIRKFELRIDRGS